MKLDAALRLPSLAMQLGKAAGLIAALLGKFITLTRSLPLQSTKLGTLAQTLALNWAAVMLPRCACPVRMEREACSMAFSRLKVVK